MLKEKQPEGKKSHYEALLKDIPDNVLHVKFDSINAVFVEKAAAKSQGRAGPSGMNAEGWKHILTSTSFGKSSTDLCKTLAEVIKKLCSSKHNSTSLEAFLACRLIPLDKNTGLRPIGIGEILRRIAGKLITSIRNEIIESVGSLQVCAGHDAGCESLIHAMQAMYQDETTEDVIVVDASNAFNS